MTRCIADCKLKALEGITVCRWHLYNPGNTAPDLPRLTNEFIDRWYLSEDTDETESDKNEAKAVMRQELESIIFIARQI